MNQSINSRARIEPRGNDAREGRALSCFQRLREGAAKRAGKAAASYWSLGKHFETALALSRSCLELDNWQISFLLTRSD